MTAMFTNAKSFSQNIGSWDISNVNSMKHMFWGISLSTENYDAILTSWASQNVINIDFDGGKSKYSSDGEIARNILTSPKKNWRITDGGLLTDDEE